MQVVIEIPEERYEEYKRIGDSRDILFEDIRKGTVLPKHHGDLIDRNELLKKEVWGSFGEIGDDAPCVFKADIEDAHTIVGATKEGE